MGKAFAKALFKADHFFWYVQLQRDSGGLSIKTNWSQIEVARSMYPSFHKK